MQELESELELEPELELKLEQGSCSGPGPALENDWEVWVKKRHCLLRWTPAGVNTVWSGARPPDGLPHRLC